MKPGKDNCWGAFPNSWIPGFQIQFFFTASPFIESIQCAMKNFFSRGRNMSEVPMIGRSVAVICKQTRTKIKFHSRTCIRRPLPVVGS